MSDNVIDCPRCRVRMEPGYVLDFSHTSSQKRIRWIEGAPEKRLFGDFRTRGKRQFDVMAHRCRLCGYLIWFAPDPSGNAG